MTAFPKKNNVVRVRFTPENDWSGKRSVDITFYVNDTLDDRSYADKDPEILPGVLHVILQFLIVLCWAPFTALAFTI